MWCRRGRRAGLMMLNFLIALGSGAALYLMFERPVNNVLRWIASDRATNFGPAVAIFALFGLGGGAFVMRLGYDFLGTLLAAPFLMIAIGGVRLTVGDDR